MVITTLWHESAVVSPNLQPQSVLASILPTDTGINVSASYDVLPAISHCECIEFIKEYYPGFKSTQLFTPNFVWNHYKKFGLEITKPEKGSLIIFKGVIGHIAVVASVSESEIEIVEKNHIPCKTGRRTIEISSESIQGFLK